MFQIEPCAKPRMTQRDKWAKRPAVVKYRDFKDQCRALKIDVQSGDKVNFLVPMPKSWSKKKRRDMAGKPHTQRPDLDNYLKALFDAVLEEDSHIWAVSAEKRWAEDGAIIIERAD